MTEPGLGPYLDAPDEGTTQLNAYLIQKYFDPQGAYRDSLSALSHPDAFELLVTEPGHVVERRELTEEEAREVASRPHIAAVEPDYTASTPPMPPEGAEIKVLERLSAAQTRARHGIDKLHERGIKGRGARIAVIDTGIDERLAARLGSRLVSAESFISGEDWRDNTGDSHGSWCISVIAAACPEAEIVSIKGLSAISGSGTYSGVIRCIERARASGCTEISLSLGGPASQILDDSVNAADSGGSIVAAAAGNEQGGTTAYQADATSPARAAGALCVAAFGSDMVVAGFSNWGTAVDLGALGVYLECADPDIAPGYWSGTSMATPYGAAIAALLRSAGANKSEAKQALLAGCKDTAEPTWEEGQGFADALASYQKLQPAPTTPRRISISRFSDLPPDPVTEEMIVTYRRNDYARVRPL